MSEISLKFKIPNNFEIKRNWNKQGQLMQTTVNFTPKMINQKFRYFVKKWMPTKIIGCAMQQREDHVLMVIKIESAQSESYILKQLGKIFGSENLEMIEYGINANT